MKSTSRRVDRLELPLAMAAAAAIASGAIAAARLGTDGIQNLVLAGILALMVTRQAAVPAVDRSGETFGLQLAWIVAAGLAIGASVFHLDARMLEPLILLALLVTAVAFTGYRQVGWLVPGCAVVLPILLSLLAIDTPIAGNDLVAVLATAAAVASAAAALAVFDRHEAARRPSGACFLAASLALLAWSVRDERVWSTGAILLVGIALLIPGDAGANSRSSQKSLEPPVFSTWIAVLAAGTGGAAMVAAAVGAAPFGWRMVGAIGAGIVGLGATVFDTDWVNRDRIRRLHQAALESRIDALTGLSNRRGIEERLEEEIARAQRYGHPLSILMIDLDDFKSINDRYGHGAGDDAMRQIAGTIGGSVRSIDVAGRFGGEEFLVLLPETAIGGAEVVAERMRISVAESGMATISVGIAQLETDQPDSNVLVTRADDALYAAKSAGKNRIALAR